MNKFDFGKILILQPFHLISSTLFQEIHNMNEV